MYTISGQEVRSFSQLRNEFADVDTFYLSAGSISGVTMSPVRRSRSRQPQAAAVEDVSKQRRARSKSRPRALYAAENEIIRNNGTFSGREKGVGRTCTYLKVFHPQITRCLKCWKRNLSGWRSRALEGHFIHLSTIPRWIIRHLIRRCCWNGCILSKNSAK